jgi:hypothetical protein
MTVDVMERYVSHIISELPELVFAILAICGVEFVPLNALRGGAMDRPEMRERVEQFGDFTTFWVAWLLTGARCGATFFAHAAEPSTTCHGMWILIGVLITLGIAYSLFMLARKGCSWFYQLPKVWRGALRVVPLLFVASTLGVNLQNAIASAR